MTRKENCSLLDCAWYLLVILISTPLPFIGFVNGGNVVFYKDVGFKGPVLYNFTLPAEVDSDEYRYWEHKSCFNLNQTEEQPSSLKTPNFIILLDYPNCDGAVYVTNLTSVYQLALSPGEYPDLRKYLDDFHFPCRVLSFEPYYNPDAFYITNTLHFLEDTKGGHLVTVENLCGCVDLPKFTYERVRTLYKNDHCVELFSKPKCEGKSVKIGAGETAASEDLRRIGFKGATKSVRLCEQTSSSCVNDKTTVRDDRAILIRPYLPLQLKEEEQKPQLKQSFLKAEPPSNAPCENGTSFICVTSCGGVIHSKSGAIQYKLDESLESFERCVWIVKLEANRSRFNVTQIWSGFKSIRGKQEVVVSGYELREDWNEISRFQLKTLRFDETTHNLELDGDILFMIITLYTDDLKTGEANGGFIIEYNSVPLVDTSEYPVSSFATDFRMGFGADLCYSSASQKANERFLKYDITTFLFLPNHRNELETGLKEFVVEIDGATDIAVWNNTISLCRFVGYKWTIYTQSRRQPGRMTPSIGNDDMILIFLRSQSPQGICFNSSVQEYKVCVGGIPVRLGKLGTAQKNASLESGILDDHLSFFRFLPFLILFLCFCMHKLRNLYFSYLRF